jgi:hypothetical protein
MMSDLHGSVSDEKGFNVKSLNGKSFNGKSLHVEHYAVAADERYHFDAADLDQVQRRLKQRHVQM